MEYKVLITGSNGQLGSEIQEQAAVFKNHHFIYTDVDDLDITTMELVEKFCIDNRITHIINCAAYTAVDKAESENELNDLVNHKAVVNLGKVAVKLGIALIHLSTDYVFDGKNYTPYKPDQETDPVNAYGQAKNAGEQALLGMDLKNSCIVRTSWVYSQYGNNFVKTILRLAEEKESLTIINDQVGVPTYASDLAHFILHHAIDLKSDSCDIYHYTNEGVCSWYDFAQEIVELSGKKCSILPIPTSSYPTPADRPYYSLLDKESTKEKFSMTIPYWKSSLKKCLILLSEK